MEKVESVLNRTLYHTSANCGESANYEWNRTLLAYSGFSSLTTFLLLIGTLTFIVKNLIVSKNGNQTNVNKNVAKSSIVRVPLHVLLQYLWQHRGDIPSTIASVNQKYGSAWRFGFFGIKNFVLINNAEMLQKLLSSANPAHLKKPSFIYHSVLTGEIKNGLVSSDVTTWKAHRSVLSKAFTYENLRYHLSVFDKHAKKLVLSINDTLTETGESPDNVDHEKSLHSLVHVSAFGMIMEIVTGKNILSDADTYLFHSLFDKCKELTSYRIYHPWYLMFDWAWNLHPVKKEMDRYKATLEKMHRQIVKKTRETIDNNKNINNEDNDTIVRKSLVEYMMKGGLPDEEISTEVATFLILGHETISMSANILMFNLAVNPQYQKKCHEEVDQLFDKLDSMNEGLSLESLNDLKYLEKCIKENLRLYPTAPGMARELESPLPLDDNTVLQSGDVVLAFSYFLHRRAEYYPNPTEFDPERFSVENCRNRGLYEYIPFSLGRRDCIGWKPAMVELKVLAAYILRNFEVHTTNPKDYLLNQFDKCIWPCADVGVRLRKRR